MIPKEPIHQFLNYFHRRLLSGLIVSESRRVSNSKSIVFENAGALVVMLRSFPACGETGLAMAVHRRPSKDKTARGSRNRAQPTARRSFHHFASVHWICSFRRALSTSCTPCLKCKFLIELNPTNRILCGFRVLN